MPGWLGPRGLRPRARSARALLVLEELLRKDLDRDVPFEARVPRPVDLPIPPAPRGRGLRTGRVSFRARGSSRRHLRVQLVEPVEDDVDLRRDRARIEELDEESPPVRRDGVAGLKRAPPGRPLGPRRASSSPRRRAAARRRHARDEETRRRACRRSPSVRRPHRRAAAVARDRDGVAGPAVGADVDLVAPALVRDVRDRAAVRRELAADLAAGARRGTASRSRPGRASGGPLRAPLSSAR